MISFDDAHKRLSDFYAPNGPGNPPNSFQASKVGRPCARYLYFLRDPEAWKLRKPFDGPAAYEMDRGTERQFLILEKAKELLAPDGYQDWVYDRPGMAEDLRLQCYDADLDIRGRVDALCFNKPSNLWLAVEVKTMATYTWERIETADDLKNAEEHYLQAYYGQLQAYLYNKALEQGFFILEAKERPSAGYPLKFVPVALDYEWFQGPIDRIGIAKKALLAGGPPEPVAYTKKGCGMCEFLAVCGNDPRKLPADPKLPPDLEDNLAREFELKPTADEYEKVKKANREAVKGVSQAVCGRFYITGEEKTRTTKPTEGKTTMYWQSKIEEIGD